MNTYKRIIYFCGKFLKILPRKKVVLFRSFQGQYNDNPKYISEELHNIRNDIKIIWAISDVANNDDIPKYVNKVKYNSLLYYYYILRSKIIVDNYLGIIYSSQKKKSKFFENLVTDSKQFNLSTWHGIPLKKIGKDEKKNNGQYDKNTFYSSTDVVMLNSKFMLNIMQHVYGINKFKLLGSPRNDILFNENNIDKIKIKLDLPIDKKIVLFAPTFRDSVYESGEHQIKDLNIEKLLKVLNERFEGDWIFVARVHNEVIKQIDFTKETNIINGNAHDDMAEYLLVSDVLITDYSSSMFDYLYTKKPCFLYALDRKNYEENERGFYMNIDDLPFSFSKSSDELYQNIKRFDSKKYQITNVEFLKKIGSMDDGKSSERAAKMICEFYDNGVIKIDENK